MSLKQEAWTYDRCTHKDIKIPASTFRNYFFAPRDSLRYGHIKLDEVHVAKLCEVLGLGATANSCKDVEIMLEEDLRQSPTDTAGAAASDKNRLLLNRCGRHGP